MQGVSRRDEHKIVQASEEIFAPCKLYPLTKE